MSTDRGGRFPPMDPLAGVAPGLMREILRSYRLSPLGLHGLGHWARVLDNGLRLAERTGARRRVVTLFAVFHDARRRDDGADPGHGGRGARLARELRGRRFELDDADFELLVTACARHTDGLTHSDPTVATCWDADRLDLWRVGIVPDPRRLCTEAARDPAILDWAGRRSLSDHEPPVVERWLACSRPEA